MNSKRLKSIFTPFAFIQFAECAIQDKNGPMHVEKPLHYFVMSIGGLIIFVISIVIFWQDLQEEKRVEFTVFNSQYIGKQSVRSTSQHDFPNFDVDIMKGRSNDVQDGEERSSERRRRKRKIDKIPKKQQTQGGLDLTPTGQL